MNNYRESLQWFIDHVIIKDGKEEFEKNWHKGELEKVISFREPKKMVVNENFDYVCPECGYEFDVFHYGDKFCQNCGQRLEDIEVGDLSCLKE